MLYIVTFVYTMNEFFSTDEEPLNLGKSQTFSEVSYMNNCFWAQYFCTNKMIGLLINILRVAQHFCKSS